MTWIPRTIGRQLRDTAAAYPDHPFLVGNGLRLTFAEADEKVDGYAAGLAECGLGRGDALALWLPNVPEWVLLWFAAARLGAMLVPLNTRYRAQEARFILEQSDAKILVLADRYFGIDYGAMLTEATESLPKLEHILTWGAAALPGTRPLAGLAGAARLPAQPHVEPTDTTIIVYTSGTTGVPKGAMHDHGILRNADNIARVQHMVPGDRILGHMPFYHVAGSIAAVLPALLRGCTLYTMDHWEPVAALELIAGERITIAGGIPTHYIDLLDAKKVRDLDTSCLKSAWIGGADVSPKVAEAAQRILGFDALLSVYGMTETAAYTCSARFGDPLETVCDNRGKPVGDFEVKVVDPATGAELPAGRDGEVRVRGHIVMRGYYKRPDATAECMTADGWFRTGDIGNFDGRGYLKITGRAKEMFIVGGSNAYPAEIERFIQAHPAVKQAVVVGTPHPRLGEVGTAFVQPEAHGPGVTEAELAAWCRERMADYKVPRRIVFVPDFPRTATGKIRRFLLKDGAGAGDGQ